jgi:hypothetical protein
MSNNRSLISGFHSVDDSTLESKVIFEILLSNRNSVFMSLSKYSCNKNSCVVVVDSEKFLKLWQKEPYGCETFLSNGNIQIWQKDNKHHLSEKGFSFGIKNPVPLSDISFYEYVDKKAVYKSKWFFVKEYIGSFENRFNYLVVGNGITRTIWLLSKSAKYFPVKCESYNSAKKLSSVAGYGENNFSVAYDLFNRN